MAVLFHQVSEVFVLDLEPAVGIFQHHGIYKFFVPVVHIAPKVVKFLGLLMGGQPGGEIILGELFVAYAHQGRRVANLATVVHPAADEDCVRHDGFDLVEIGHRGRALHHFLAFFDHGVLLGEVVEAVFLLDVVEEHGLAAVVALVAREALFVEGLQFFKRGHEAQPSKRQKCEEEENKYNNKKKSGILKVIPSILAFPVSYFSWQWIIRTKGNGEFIDFNLVKDNGAVDVLEVKKPDCNSIISTVSDHGNYYSTKTLSLVVMQTEKYIYNLNRNIESAENSFDSKYSKLSINEKLKAIGDISINMIEDIAKLYYPNSDDPMFEVSIEQLVYFLSYMSKRINFVIDSLLENELKIVDVFSKYQIKDKKLSFVFSKG